MVTNTRVAADLRETQRRAEEAELKLQRDPLSGDFFPIGHSVGRPKVICFTLPSTVPLSTVGGRIANTPLIQLHGHVPPQEHTLSLSSVSNSLLHKAAAICVQFPVWLLQGYILQIFSTGINILDSSQAVLLQWLFFLCGT
ncbi:uncharacterized protein LOC141955563 isoform X2 [Athene noctua]|uniref:uncharacterized protein LOC141955560 isoform X2 n=1 Tax=Athene noctua TaxID=126797 RepID=UPI003EBBF4B4